MSRHVEWVISSIEKRRNEGKKKAGIKKGRGFEFITYGSWECRDDRGGQFDQIA